MQICGQLFSKTNEQLVLLKQSKPVFRNNKSLDISLIEK